MRSTSRGMCATGPRSRLRAALRGDRLLRHPNRREPRERRSGLTGGAGMPSTKTAGFVAVADPGQFPEMTAKPRFALAKPTLARRSFWTTPREQAAWWVAFVPVDFRLALPRSQYLWDQCRHFAEACRFSPRAKGPSCQCCQKAPAPVFDRGKSARSRFQPIEPKITEQSRCASCSPHIRR
jgi:hypothetical protein